MGDVPIITIGMIVSLLVGIVSGLNQGIMLAEENGPKGACEALRISLINCSKFKDPRP